MAIQSKLGKAFEFACIQSLYNHLSAHQSVVVEETGYGKSGSNTRKTFALLIGKK